MLQLKSFNEDSQMPLFDTRSFGLPKAFIQTARRQPCQFWHDAFHKIQVTGDMVPEHLVISVPIVGSYFPCFSHLAGGLDNSDVMNDQSNWVIRFKVVESIILA